MEKYESNKAFINPSGQYLFDQLNEWACLAHLFMFYERVQSFGVFSRKLHP